MTSLKTALFAAGLTLSSAFSYAKPIKYDFDIAGAHSFVQFKASHLGISHLYGRFNKFDGEFIYDPENDANNSVTATVDLTSVDSNHAERDVHLRKDDFLHVQKYGTATFKSTSFKTLSKDKASLTGELTFLGVTKTVTFDVDILGHGVAPWEKDKGLVRQGFEARTMLDTNAFGMKSEWVGKIELIVSVEGIGKP